MGREAPASELAQAFTSYADQLLDRLQRLERRALTLELVVEILVQDGAAGSQLRRAVLRKLEEELRHCVIANSPNLEAVAALAGMMLELLPDQSGAREHVAAAG